PSWSAIARIRRLPRGWIPSSIRLPCAGCATCPSPGAMTAFPTVCRRWTISPAATPGNSPGACWAPMCCPRRCVSPTTARRQPLPGSTAHTPHRLTTSSNRGGVTTPRSPPDEGVACELVPPTAREDGLPNYPPPPLLYRLDRHFFYPLRIESYDREGKLVKIE